MKALEFLGSSGDFELSWGGRLVLAGPCHHLARLCLRKARASWGLPEEEAEPAAMEEAMAAGGLFGPRLVVVRADGLEKRLAKLATADYRGRLIVVAGSWKGDVRDGAVIDCGEPRPMELAEHLQGLARGDGLELDLDAAGLLTPLGTDLAAAELGKLVCYCLGKVRIRRADVEAVCVQATGSSRAWKIVGELKEGGDPWKHLEAAFRGCENEREMGFSFLAQIGAPLRKLARSVALRRSGREAVAALREAGVEEWNLGQAAAAIGFLRKRVLRIYDWILEADGGLKSSGARPRAICAVLVARLMGQPKAQGRP